MVSYDSILGMYIEFTLTLGCKNNCSYCPQDKIVANYLRHNELPTRVMELKTFKKIIDKLPRYMDVAIGGMSEPFQNPDCADMVLYAKQKNHSIFLCTTLVGLSKTRLQTLLDAVFLVDRKSTIILHVPSKEKLECIPVNNEFIDMLDMILKSGVTAEYHYHGKHIHPLVGQKLREFHVTPIYIQPKPRAGNLALNEKTSVKRKVGAIFCNRHNLDGHVILPDGRVVLCCMDYSMKHKLGNASMSSYDNIHNGPVNSYINEGMIDDSYDILCRYCHGAQYIDAYSAYRNMDVSVSKFVLASKLIVYNRVFPLYDLLYRSKHFFQKKIQKSKTHWLYVENFSLFELFASPKTATV
jgi:hypothetical protein